jgi:hypothetical protein
MGKKALLASGAEGVAPLVWGEWGMRQGWLRLGFAVVVALVAVGLTACQPGSAGGLQTTTVACNHVDLSWTAATEAGGTIVSYVVLRDGAAIHTVAAPTTTYSDTSVVASHPNYSYTVQAFDAKGVGAKPSNAVSVSTPACPSLGVVPMYCRSSKMSVQADKEQAYQRCAVDQGGFYELCSARAENVPAKLSFYDDLDATEPSYSSPEQDMYNLANASHESWFLHDSGGHRIEYSGYTIPNFDLYDTGNAAFDDQWATIAKQWSSDRCADLVFADNTGAPDLYSSAKPEYSSRVGGAWPVAQQYSDGATAATRIANDMGSETYCGNFAGTYNIYDNNGVVDPNVRANYLAQPCTMIENFLIDFGDLPPDHRTSWARSATPGSGTRSRDSTWRGTSNNTVTR